VGVSLSAAARTLEPVLRHATRVYRERQAVRVPSAAQSDLLDNSFNETLSRLLTGRVESSWWQSLLAAIEQPLVASDFLQNPALQDWLSRGGIQEDLKAEARQEILGAENKNAERRVRLRSAYANITGERKELANGPISIVVGVLVAGYLASLSSQLTPVVAIVQASHADTKEDLTQIKKTLDALAPQLAGSEDKIVTKAHTHMAAERLNIITKCRGFSPEKDPGEHTRIAPRRYGRRSSVC